MIAMSVNNMVSVDCSGRSTAILVVVVVASFRLHTSAAWCSSSGDGSSSRSKSLHDMNRCADRRTILISALLTSAFVAPAAVPSSISLALETIGKDPSCNDASCLGVWDGLLADCPPPQPGRLSILGAGCVASQDDTPGVFAEPWDYSDSDYFTGRIGLPLQQQQRSLIERILDAIQDVSNRRGDTVRALVQEGSYLRVVFTDGRSNEQSIGEFYLTPNDTTVQFRIAASVGRLPSSSSWLTSSLRNKDRAELIRIALKFDKVPVLRNRNRSFWFVESDDLDTFGPSSNALFLEPLEQRQLKQLDPERQRPQRQKQ